MVQVPLSVAMHRNAARQAKDVVAEATVRKLHAAAQEGWVTAHMPQWARQRSFVVDGEAPR